MTMTRDEQLDRIRDAFREAALQDVPQVTQILSTSADRPERGEIISRGTGDTSYCATGWLWEKGMWLDVLAVRNDPVDRCPICGGTEFTAAGEGLRPLRTFEGLLVHYNNDHKMGWLDLAGKI